MTSEQNASDFIDIVSYERLEIPSKGIRGNLIKGSKVACTGAKTIEVSTEDSGQPSVITHSEGEVIVAVEFRCKCGCSAMVALDYTHE